jgi:chemotaxis protein MotA
MRRWISKNVLFTVMLSGLITLAAIFYSTTSSFLSIAGLFVVIGGCVANALLSYQREDVYKAFSTIKHMLEKPKAKRDGLHKDIMRFIQWAYVVQADDFLGLEKASNDIRDPFLRYGMDLAITGYSAEKIRDMLHTVAEAEFERRCLPVTVLRNMAATAPTFGMVGTLIGMVTLLQNVGADITGIGGGLAIAMLSTLYGILVARLICLPAADKLLLNEERARFRNYMLTEGLVMLSEKQSPFYVQDKLNSFLEPTKHFKLGDLEQLASQRRYSMAA